MRDDKPDVFSHLCELCCTRRPEEQHCVRAAAAAFVVVAAAAYARQLRPTWLRTTVNGF